MLRGTGDACTVAVMYGVEQLHRFTGTLTNNIYVIEGGEGLVVVDPGMPFDQRLLPGRVRGLGRSPRDITDVLLTHFHVDHSGSSFALKDSCGARLYAHAADAPFIEGTGRIPSVYRAGVQGRFLMLFAGTVERVCDYPDARVDEPLAGGQVLPLLGGIKVFHAPGHTPGSCCFLWLEKGVLFSGDAVVNEYLFPTISERGYCRDYGLAGRSAVALIEALEDEEYWMVCTGHGPAIRNNAKGKLRALARYLRWRERRGGTAGQNATQGQGPGVAGNGG